MDKKIKREEVMVFPSKILDDLGRFQGLEFNIEGYLPIIKENLTFQWRETAEQDISYKQLIPYVLFYHHGCFFSYRRGKKLSEERLKGNYSIGVGGHISRKDENMFVSEYKEAMYREVNEEVKIESDYNDYAIALINDDSNDVGKVHFGIVHLFDLKTPKVKKKEQSINEPKFVSIQDLNGNYDNYENWSKICISNIDEIVKIINHCCPVKS